jgi:hypothetical protein
MVNCKGVSVMLSAVPLFSLLFMVAGCARYASKPLTPELAKQVEALESIKEENATKIADYIKRTGHGVTFKPLFYTENGTLHYYETVGDFRQRGLSSRMGLTPEDPDDRGICYYGTDAQTGEDVKDSCLTVPQLRRLGLIR